MIIYHNAFLYLLRINYRPYFASIEYNIFIATLHILLIYMLTSTLIILQILEYLIELLPSVGTSITDKVHGG